MISSCCHAIDLQAVHDTPEIQILTSVLLLKQDVSAKTKALTAEVTELKKKRQQAERSLAELKKKSRNVEVNLATEKGARQGLEADLIAADKRRQTAEELLDDLRRTSSQAAKVSYYTTCLASF